MPLELTDGPIPNGAMALIWFKLSLDGLDILKGELPPNFVLVAIPERASLIPRARVGAGH